MGTLGDTLFLHPETWPDVAALAAFVRSLPDGEADGARPGIQQLVYDTVFRYVDEAVRIAYAGLPRRDAIEQRLRSLGDRDADALMPYYDRPAELRERMAALIQRFYEEHYRPLEAERMRALAMSVAAHRDETTADPAELTRRLTGRVPACLEVYCGLDFERYIFAPSMDMGPYTSCASLGAVHGLFYPLEARFWPGGAEDEEQVRLARLFKALADEQRLKILSLLRGREMYAQEIVEAMGLHQSVVSRHLSFMKAVGLLSARKQNNMKFYSINPHAREALGKSFDLLVPSAGGQR